MGWFNWYLNSSSLGDYNTPRAFTRGSYPLSRSTSVTQSACGMYSNNSGTLDNHFLAYIPAIAHNFESCLYNLIRVIRNWVHAVIHVGTLQDCVGSEGNLCMMLPCMLLCDKPHQKRGWIYSKYNTLKLKHIRIFFSFQVSPQEAIIGSVGWF